MSLFTLSRLQQFLHQEQQLCLVDDGTLTLEDIQIINTSLKNIKIFTRSEREDKILRFLENKPECIKFRNESPLAFKLIDIPILASEISGRLIYTDTDIIYIKNCQAYFSGEQDLFLRTYTISLSVKLKYALLKYRWKIPYQFNSGMFSFDLAYYDLDFIEYYLGLPEVRHFLWHTEETGWALLFGRLTKSKCPSVNQFICRADFNGPNEDTLAIHMIADLKKNYSVWSEESKNYMNHGVEVQLEKSRNITLFDWLKKSVDRLILSRFENSFS